MKKKLLALIMVMTMISLTACGNAVDSTKESVGTYNEAVKTYNEQAGDYITAAQATVDANKELNDVMTGAQEVINKGEEPFDEETLTNLHMAHPNGRFCGAKRPKCEAEQPLGFD